MLRLTEDTALAILQRYAYTHGAHCDCAACRDFKAFKGTIERVRAREEAASKRDWEDS